MRSSLPRHETSKLRVRDELGRLRGSLSQRLHCVDQVFAELGENSASRSPSFSWGDTGVIIENFDAIRMTWAVSVSHEPGQELFVPSLAGVSPLSPPERSQPKAYDALAPARARLTYMCRDCDPKLRWRTPAAVLEHRARHHAHLNLMDFREVRA